MVGEREKGKAREGFGASNVTSLGLKRERISAYDREIASCIERHVQDVETFYAAHNIQILVNGKNMDVIGASDDAVKAVKNALKDLNQRYIADPSVMDGGQLSKILRKHPVNAYSGGGYSFKAGGVTIKPQSENQKSYLKAIDNHTLTFGVGPAGSGKTFLAVAKAVEAYNAGKVKKIILTRPAVDAGEKIGHLPGTAEDKLAPYLRPLYDALDEFLGTEKSKRMREQGEIEVAPIGFMRGRDIKDAFIVVDEAQNTTVEQMKMIMTRIGRNSMMVICGDPLQNDLGTDRQGNSVASGLVYACEQLSPFDTSFVDLATLEGKDVVRSPVVAHIISKMAEKPEPEAIQEIQKRIGLAGGPK